MKKTQENLEGNFDASCRNITEPPNNEKFRPQPVTVDTVILTFKQLNETNAVGSDELGFKFLKDSFLVLAFYITTSRELSLRSGFC